MVPLFPFKNHLGASVATLIAQALDVGVPRDKLAEEMEELAASLRE
jgi:hypothetical protein